VRKLFAILIAVILSGTSAFAYSDEYATPKTWLEGYKPNYFLFGNPDSKIQLSAKAQLFEEKRLYFAYSQVMFWEIGRVSSPITDVNFNPELFYRFDLSGAPKEQDTSPDDPVARGDKTWLDVGLLEHESNGEADPFSRSWNRSYVKYVLESDYDDGLRLYSTFKAWFPWKSSFDRANADLLYYRGLYEIELTCAGLLGERSDVTLRLYAGGPSHVNPFEGGQELTLRFGVGHGRLVPLWTVQIFNGYAEDLLFFDRRRTMLRAGLSY
jgi:phospholipase A1